MVRLGLGEAVVESRRKTAFLVKDTDASLKPDAAHLPVAPHDFLRTPGGIELYPFLLRVLDLPFMRGHFLAGFQANDLHGLGALPPSCHCGVDGHVSPTDHHDLAA